MIHHSKRLKTNSENKNTHKAREMMDVLPIEQKQIKWQHISPIKLQKPEECDTTFAKC